MTKLLILDLDETIIHSTREWIGYPPTFEDEMVGFLFVRPGLQRFVKSVMRNYRLAVWSSATEGYVSAVVERVLKDVPIEFSWSRTHCELAHMDDGTLVLVKNLDRVQDLGFQLSNVVVVDDRPEALGKHAANLVTVQPFYGGEDDDELSHLSSYLDRIYASDDLRLVEKSAWRLLVRGD